MLQMLQDFLAFFPFISSPECSCWRLIYFLYFLLQQADCFESHEEKLFIHRTIRAQAAGASPVMDLTRVYKGHKGKHCPHCTGPQLIGKRAHPYFRNIQTRDFLQKKLPKKSTSKCEAIWEGGHTDDHFFWKTVDSPNCEEHHSWPISNHKV